MKLAGLWLVVVIAVLAAGGILVYRSTAPNGDVVPQGEASLEEAPAAGTSNSQFLQMQPDSAPPGEAGDDGEGGEASPVAETSETELPADQDVAERTVISMTDMGFSPEEVTVAAGSTVTFVNNGQALHWPASDVHPTHELLPGFDAGRGIATGDEYAFTFTKVGAWSFHDHLNPQFTGTVVVE